jgi:hypothetical protein
MRDMAQAQGPEFKLIPPKEKKKERAREKERKSEREEKERQTLAWHTWGDLPKV